MSEQIVVQIPEANQNRRLPADRLGANGDNKIRQSENGQSLRFQSAPYHVLNGAVYFNGHCDACRPFCAAVCCRGYAFVSLTETEAKSGRYAYKEASDTCNCQLCQRMKEANVRYILHKHPNGSCIYLDGSGQCSIYEDRPETCRKYSCTNIAFMMSPQ
jgi:hypothetical protein